MKRFPERSRLPRDLAALALVAILGACAAPARRPESVPVGPEAPAAGAPSAAPQASVDERFSQALQLIKDHKPDEAQTALESLVHDFPAYSGPQTNLGILYARAKQRDKAFASFNRAVTANPKNATAYDWLGILYRESGDYGNAERAYLSALTAQPEDAAAHFNLGVLYDAYLHRPQDAVKQYSEYQRIAGDKPIVNAWINELQPPATSGDAPATSAAPAAAGAVLTSPPQGGARP